MNAAQMAERMTTLGDTSAAIAASLRATGIKGKYEDERKCLLAVWACRQDDGRKGWAVVTTPVRVVAPGEWDGSILSNALAEFVDLYDAGEYLNWWPE